MDITINTSCWVITAGQIGTENQCLGLAAALGLTPTVKRIRLRAPWRLLAPYFNLLNRFAFSRAGDFVTAPFPNLVIAAGRRSLPAVFYIKQQSPSTKIIQLQDPRCLPWQLKNFDMVIVPEHDRLRGPNVISTLGALNRITPELIAAAATKWQLRWAHLPPEKISVLIGGKSAIYQFSTVTMQQIITQLESVLALHPNAALLITASRRTPPDCLTLLQNFAATKSARVWLWDGTNDNPYFAMLGSASHIIITADSVSMISEAAVTGKPIHLIQLNGGSKKFDKFYAALAARSIYRIFHLPLANWAYKPLYETNRIAELIKEKI